MITRFAYSTAFAPPAPVIPVGIASPVDGNATMHPMLVDTGADLTLLPAALVRRLGLPQVDVIAFTGVGSARQHATVHAASLTLAGRPLIARIVAFPSESILGRDVLNHFSLTLDGPHLALSVRTHARRPRRPAKR